MNGYYDISVAGGGVCREARDGACVMYIEMGADEGHPVDGGRHGMQGSRAHENRQGVERVRETACAQGSNAGECKTCGATIGADTYCSACNGENYAPVNGVCVDASTSPGNTFCTKDESTGTCSTCKGASSMYQGGCYQTGASNPGILSALLHQKANAQLQQRGTSSHQALTTLISLWCRAEMLPTE